MRNPFLKSSIALILVAGCVFATPEKEPAKKYSHRISALQSSVSYELLGDNSLHLGFESYVAGAWRSMNDTTKVGVIEARVGHTFSMDMPTRVTPMIGATVFRDLEEKTLYVSVPNEDKSQSKTISSVNFIRPYIVFGMAGLGVEHDVCGAVSVGVSLKGLIGKAAGAAQSGFKDMSFGFHAALPVTFHFGKERNWDFRLEPFALKIADASKFLGGRANIGYRF